MTICLVMIVKDEAKVIQRCLESAKPHIDHWVICDTGSTDETPDIVQRVMSGIPGVLYKDTWKDFGHNRSLAVQRAKDTADFLLLMDADMTLECWGKPDPSVGSYLVPYTGGLSYRQKLLVSGRLDWRYVGSTHEYITTATPHMTADADFLALTHHADGSSRTTKFDRDLELLHKDWDEKQDARTAFYLGQTLKDLGMHEDAAIWYAKRVSLGGWDEEVFYAQLQLGRCYEAFDWPKAAEAYLRAWHLRPSRAEPLYYLAKGFRERHSYWPACLFAKAATELPKPDDKLFVHSEVYEWGALFEYSIAAYWVGKYRDAWGAADYLREKKLPDQIRDQNHKNLEFIRAKL